MAWTTCNQRDRIRQSLERELERTQQLQAGGVEFKKNSPHQSDTVCGRLFEAVEVCHCNEVPIFHLT